MPRPALDHPWPGVVPAKPCDNPDCRTIWGYVEAGRNKPIRRRGLCARCWYRWLRIQAKSGGLGTRAERAPFPPVKAWRWRSAVSDPTPDEIAAICLEIRTAMANQGRPKVPTGCTLTLHKPHHSEPHVYRTPETT